MSGHAARPRIVHRALEVDDLARTMALYRDVVGLTEVETTKVRDHRSRHLTDGAIGGGVPRTHRGFLHATGEPDCVAWVNNREKS